MPLSVLQRCQPQDPLNTTLVIPNFVRYSYIQTSASERIEQIKQMLGSFKIFLGKIVPNGLKNGKWAYVQTKTTLQDCVFSAVYVILLVLLEPV